MDLEFTAADDQFRGKVRDWLNTKLNNEFKEARGRGGPGARGAEGPSEV